MGHVVLHTTRVGHALTGIPPPRCISYGCSVARIDVRRRVVRYAYFGEPGGELFRNVWPNPMAIQHRVAHVDHLQ